jgi:hypothetical protein
MLSNRLFISCLFFNSRLCEICGETAKNVSVAANNGFIEEWNDRRFVDNDGNSSQQRFGGRWRGQPGNSFHSAMVFSCEYVLAWESNTYNSSLFNSSYLLI